MTTPPPPFFARAGTWLHGHLPTRETIAANRWLAPFAPHLLNNGLWRLNRRSVPRGVALGLFAGLAVPFAHTIIAALLAIPLRANVLIAAGTTVVSNPITWIVIFPLERSIGRFLIGLNHINPAVHVAAQAGSSVHGWLSVVLKTSGEIALGSVVLAIAAGVVGYVLVSLIWRFRMARKWRGRHDRGPIMAGGAGPKNG
ncbi:DUF2062 domain-containing protein [Sphingomonas sp.]|uniref:DUF2062 domain-containing protein n=1 Tax=Sphingomonas sp. TaxID=28214 RepID=UPI0025EEC0C3|nr:DUF2062 domain-containing protein [Sphingomonas sp.]